MTNNPIFPQGICRDDTVHGELYYTSEQLCAAIEAARIDALEEAKTLVENYPFWLGTTAKAEICAAIESLKGKTP